MKQQNVKSESNFSELRDEMKEQNTSLRGDINEVKEQNVKFQDNINKRLDAIDEHLDSCLSVWLKQIQDLSLIHI